MKNKAKQSNARQSSKAKTVQSKADQIKAEQSKAVQRKTKQSERQKARHTAIERFSQQRHGKYHLIGLSCLASRRWHQSIFPHNYHGRVRQPRLVDGGPVLIPARTRQSNEADRTPPPPPPASHRDNGEIQGRGSPGERHQHKSGRGGWHDGAGGEGQEQVRAFREKKNYVGKNCVGHGV